MSTLMTANRNLSALSNNWGWLLLWGIALVVLGAVAISAATLTTILSVIFLGVLILIGGVVILIDTFKSWWGRWGGFFLHFIIALLYIAAGVMLIKNPLSVSISLTLLLGCFYTVLGIVRIVESLSYRLPQWGLGFLGGIIALLLGILILENWPGSSLFIIGLFVGIDLLLSGFTYIIIALSVRDL